MCRMPTPIETRGRTLAEDPSITLQLVGLEVKVKENRRFCVVRVFGGSGCTAPIRYPAELPELLEPFCVYAVDYCKFLAGRILR